MQASQLLRGDTLPGIQKALTARIEVVPSMHLRSRTVFDMPCTSAAFSRPVTSTLRLPDITSRGEVAVSIWGFKATMILAMFAYYVLRTRSYDCISVPATPAKAKSFTAVLTNTLRGGKLPRGITVPSRVHPFLYCGMSTRICFI